MPNSAPWASIGEHREREGAEHDQSGETQRLLRRRFHQTRQARHKDVGAVEAGQHQEAQAGQQQKDAGKPNRRIGIDRKPKGAGEIPPAAKLRRQQVDEECEQRHRDEAQYVTKDRAKNSVKYRGVHETFAGYDGSDEAGADEAKDRGNERKQSDVAEQQIGKIVGLLLDPRPFGEGIGEDRWYAQNRVHDGYWI